MTVALHTCEAAAVCHRHGHGAVDVFGRPNGIVQAAAQELVVEHGACAPIFLHMDTMRNGGGAGGGGGAPTCSWSGKDCQVKSKMDVWGRPTRRPASPRAPPTKDVSITCASRLVHRSATSMLARARMPGPIREAPVPAAAHADTRMTSAADSTGQPTVAEILRETCRSVGGRAPKSSGRAETDERASESSVAAIRGFCWVWGLAASLSALLTASAPATSGLLAPHTAQSQCVAVSGRRGAREPALSRFANSFPC